MGWTSALGATVAAALLVAAPTVAAPASDAQVEAALVRAISVVDHQRATSLRNLRAAARLLSRAAALLGITQKAH